MRFIIYLFLLTSIQFACSETDRNNTSQSGIQSDSSSYASESGYLDGKEAYTLIDKLSGYEELIGLSENDIPKHFGTPIDTTFENKAIDERDATVYYFEYPLGELENIYMKTSVQYGKLVGIQISSRENEELLYSSARFLLASRGIDWTPSRNQRGRTHFARSGKHLMWQIQFDQNYYGRTGIINIGTVKYSTCELVWDNEHLWGEDGLGNKIDTLSSS